MFKNILINRFRSIKNINISNLKQINLFVGKNNCGKTSVLEAMFIIAGISNPKIPITLNQFRDIDYFLGDDKDYKLTQTELNILTLLILEKTNEKIAKRLELPVYKINTYIYHIYSKMQVFTQEKIAIKAVKEKLILRKQFDHVLVSPGVDKLRNSELRVLEYVAGGMSNKEIAEEFSVSVSTVKSHVNSIFSKLGVNSRRDIMDI